MPLQKAAQSSSKTSSVRTNASTSLKNSNKSSGIVVVQAATTSIKSKKSPSMSTVMDDNNNEFDTKQVPSVKEPSGIYNIVMTDSDMALTKRKFVKVSSIGEVEVSPDRVEFCIQIVCSRKDTTAARMSVHKRYEFLRLALQKLNVSPDGITTTSVVKKYKLGDELEVNANDDLLEKKILHEARTQMGLESSAFLTTARGGASSSLNEDGSPHIHNNTNQQSNRTGDDTILLNAERVKVIQELYVICNNLNQYMELFSIVNERLDRQVIVSPPIFRISPEHLQMETRGAAKLAMANAIYKAQQILQAQKFLKATVGKLFYSVEESLTVEDVQEYQNVSTSTTFENFNWKRNNKLIVCKLTSMFEVNTKGNKKNF